MKFTDLAAVAAALLALAGPAYAADKSSCTTEAKLLKGEEREKALAQCDKIAVSSTGHSQQDKMRTCNADAKKKELKGDERRAFMSRCLKG